MFMDWRHLFELTCAGREQSLTLKNLIVWDKDNAGMGTFYRSRHELVFVFKNGDGAHINNFELGQHGRYRTNVWEYAGVNTIRAGRLDELAMHPTVKPVALVAERSGTSRREPSCSIPLRQRHHADRRREDRPAARARIRSPIFRRDRAALAGLHRQARHVRGHRPYL